MLRTLLSELAAKSIVLELQQLIWPAHAETAIGQLSDALLEEICKQLHAFAVKPSGTEGYRTAEVTLGGVDTTEVSSKTMQSKREPGLFLLEKCLMLPVIWAVITSSGLGLLQLRQQNLSSAQLRFDLLRKLSMVWFQSIH